MILPQRNILPHDTPAWVRSGSIFFITVCCFPRSINQLCQEVAAAKIFEAVDFCQRRGIWHVHLLLLMPDLWHGLVSFPAQENMKKVMAGFMEATAKRTDIRWRRDFFDHRHRSGESYEAKADYIRQNPVRKGLVTNPKDWPWIWTDEVITGAPGGRALPAS